MHILTIIMATLISFTCGVYCVVWSLEKSTKRKSQVYIFRGVIGWFLLPHLFWILLILIGVLAV